MRRRPSWLLLLTPLLAGALACQGGGNKDIGGDFDPIGDYPKTGGGDGPTSDYPRQPGGAQSEESEEDAPADEAAMPPRSGDSEQRPSVDGVSNAALDAGPSFEEADAGQSEADAGEAAEPQNEADAGVSAP